MGISLPIIYMTGTGTYEASYLSNKVLWTPARPRPKTAISLYFYSFQKVISTCNTKITSNSLQDNSVNYHECPIK